jgi:hypothetical protein
MMTDQDRAAMGSCHRPKPSGAHMALALPHDSGQSPAGNTQAMIVTISI